MRLCDIPPPSEQLLQDTEHSFYVCLAGSLTLDVAFEKRKLKRGDIFYCAPKLEHLILSQSGSSGFVLHVPRSWWESSGYMMFEFMKVHLPPAAKAIAETLHEFGCDPSPQSSLIASLLFLSHIEMKRSCGWDEEANPWFSHRVAKAEDPRLKKAAHLIQTLCREDVDLDQVAKLSGLSTRNMRRLFQETFDMSPTEALRSLRMEFSLPLICSTKSSIEEIAAQCGYSNAAGFSRDFRLTFSMTPGRYRNRHNSVGKED